MNLLIDRIFDVGGAQLLSLPEVLAASAVGDLGGFRRVRAHQRAAWHMFRVQLAALALRQGGLSEPPDDAERWATLLRALTVQQGEDPWCLVVADRQRPAFLQPPDPGHLNWTHVATPDSLDLLITARNHDLKQRVATHATAEDWVYALVSLQTSDGYAGRRNYGIARMNAGSSSRSFLGLAPVADDGLPDLSAWWRRDLSLLLRQQHEPTALTRGGPGLLWCLPWIEGDSLPVQEMDPWVIEICRRVRLSELDGELVAHKGSSIAPRLAANEFKGVVGDAWAPVSIRDKVPTALTLGKRRFDFRLIVDLMFSGHWRVPPAARIQIDEGEGEMMLVAEALSRGNAKTNGLQSRLVPIPRHARHLMRTDARRITAMAAVQLREVDAAEQALCAAIALYAAGGDRAKVSWRQRNASTPATARLHAIADHTFFTHLWARLAHDSDEAEIAGRAFRRLLACTAQEELARAFGYVLCAALRAPRAHARSRLHLQAGLHKAGLSSQLINENQHA